jgi:hypothetical protein
MEMSGHVTHFWPIGDEGRGVPGTYGETISFLLETVVTALVLRLPFHPSFLGKVKFKAAAAICNNGL